jgi:PD-(D/E)XK nuclease superfamily protein
LPRRGTVISHGWALIHTDIAMELFEKELTGKIIEASTEISNELGPGFLESIYKKLSLLF